MSTVRLNAATVSAGLAPVYQEPPDPLEALRGLIPTGIAVTRRDAIKFGGVAATIAYGAISARTLKPFSAPVTGSTARVAWLRAGRERAVLDPARFAGTPKLTVNNNGSWSAALSAARYPGTNLPADISLATQGSGATSKIAVTMKLGGFHATVPLASWIAAETAAESWVRFHNERVSLGAGKSLVLDGSAFASLSSKDWTVRLEGSEIARVAGMGKTLVADAVTIALAAEGASSLFSHKIARRTIVTLERGDNEWTLRAPKSDVGSVTFSETGFDRLTVETAESRTGVMHRAVLADGEAASGAFKPARARGSKATIPLAGVRYARLLDDGSYHVAASLTAKPVWTKVGRASILAGGAEWAKPFSMQGGDGARTKVECSPAAYGIAAPLGGNLIASPLIFPAEAQKVVNLGTTATSAASTVNRFGSVGIPIALPTSTSLTVIRPDDMLSLKFTFFNFSYVNTGTPMLVRSNTLKSSYIAVEFPPQHILERAYFENVPPYPGQPPIEALLSDTSRLAFLVPNAVADAGVALTLASLLNWGRFEPNVVPAAESGYTPAAGVPPLLQLRKPRTGSSTYAPETSLEVPWGLYMSPASNETWRHRTTPLTSGSVTELWHTRLHGYSNVVLPPIGSDGETGPAETTGGVVESNIGNIQLPPTLRAVWGRYYEKRTPYSSRGAMQSGLKTWNANLFRNAFTTSSPTPPTPYEGAGFDNRWAVVDLTAGYHEDSVVMNHMMLSPLGAWFVGRGEWDITAFSTDGKHLQGFAANLEEWDHRATMGRDHWVKIVTAGVLFPFGHRASLITITERKFKYSPDRKRRYAYLMQRQYIKVKEPVRTFTDRGMPFRRVEIKTLLTPPIVKTAYNSTVSTGLGFWPQTIATGEKTAFEIEALDWDGRTIKFSTPLIYLELDVGVLTDTPNASWLSAVGKASTVYHGQKIQMLGQRIAYAEKPAGTLPTDGDERSLPTDWMTFSGPPDADAAIGELRFGTLMYRANVRLETVEQLTGTTTGVEIKLSSLYTDNGFNAAPARVDGSDTAYALGNSGGRIFAELINKTTPQFPGDLGGGLATPVPAFTGISATMGAVGGADLAKVAAGGPGSFDPLTYFTDVMDTELIGGITLKELLTAAASTLGLDNMPAFQQLTNPQVPDEVVIQYHWETPFTEDVLIFSPGLPTEGNTTFPCKLTLDVKARKSLSNPAQPPSYSVVANLTNFKLMLVPSFECIHLLFSGITFESVDGSSPNVTTNFKDVKFVGTLAYLETLAKYLGALGGVASRAALTEGELASAETIMRTNVIDAGPFKVDVDASGIRASLSLGIPDLAIGVFSLTNMSFGAMLKLPFNGDPVTLDFNFCTREAPCSIMVMGFGGGAYVLMTFDAQGIVMLEIGFEFGAGVAFGIGGIASGMVEIKGGLVIKYDRSMPSPSFLIYIKIHGELDILGIIKVSLTFYLELLYETFYKADGVTEGDRLIGTATLTIEIEILFISIPIELSVTKELAGKDPRFGAMMTVQSDWDTYCTAFAPAKLGA